MLCFNNFPCIHLQIHRLSTDGMISKYQTSIEFLAILSKKVIPFPIYIHLCQNYIMISNLTIFSKFIHFKSSHNKYNSRKTKRTFFYEKFYDSSLKFAFYLLKKTLIMITLYINFAAKFSIAIISIKKKIYLQRVTFPI